MTTTPPGVSEMGENVHGHSDLETWWFTSECRGTRSLHVLSTRKNRERRPEHRTRNGTGTERERNGTRTREMLVQHLRHSRLPSAFLAAGKTQLGLHKDHLLCRRSICILSRPQNASRISFPFSYLDAWPHFCLTSDLSAFCYGHKMQLGTLACGK